MQLAMTVLRCPDAVAPEARTVPGGEFTVGRGPGVDWVLPDAERQLSKRHFAVAYRAGAWQLADTSTNGTFLNREADAIGPGDLRTLRDGDRIRLGAYEIEIRLVEEAAQSAGGFGAGYGGGFGNAPAAGSSPFGDPFGMDPLAPPPAARRPFDEPAYQPGGMAPSAAQLPHDFDPLSPLGGDAQFQGPVQSDHSPVLEDAFRPPTAVGQAPLHSGGTIPGDDLLPDNWDEDLLAGIGDPPAPLAPPSAHPQARAAVPPSPAADPAYAGGAANGASDAAAGAALCTAAGPAVGAGGDTGHGAGTVASGAGASGAGARGAAGDARSVSRTGRRLAVRRTVGRAGHASGCCFRPARGRGGLPAAAGAGLARRTSAGDRACRRLAVRRTIRSAVHCAEGHAGSTAARRIARTGANRCARCCPGKRRPGRCAARRIPGWGGHAGRHASRSVRHNARTGRGI